MILWYPLGTIKTPTSNLITCPIWNPQSFRLVAMYLTACPQNNWCCLNFFPYWYSQSLPKLTWKEYPKCITKYGKSVLSVIFILSGESHFFWTFAEWETFYFILSHLELRFRSFANLKHIMLYIPICMRMCVCCMYNLLQVNYILKLSKSINQGLNYWQ